MSDDRLIVALDVPNVLDGLALREFHGITTEGENVLIVVKGVKVIHLGGVFQLTISRHFKAMLGECGLVVSEGSGSG